MGEASADAGLGGAANATDRPPPVSSLLDFSGETVVVTGASGGLGRGIALRFVEAGANVVVHYSKDEKHAAEVNSDATGRLVRALRRCTAKQPEAA